VVVDDENSSHPGRQPHPPTRERMKVRGSILGLVMSIFASYFWLWSIVGLVGLFMLWTIGGLMNFIGLMSPLKGVSRWIDSAPTFVKAVLAAALFGTLLYP